MIQQYKIFIFATAPDNNTTSQLVESVESYEVYLKVHYTSALVINQQT